MVHKQFVRFAAVGLTGTAVQYAMLWLGVSVFGTQAAWASGTGYIFGSVINYLLNYFFTFQSDKSHKDAAPRYFAVLGVGWCINTSLMVLFTQHWEWNIWVAQILTTGIGLIWNFSGSRLWAFKQVYMLIG